jgi:hypothetical protein
VILFRDGGLESHRDIDICLRFGFKVEVVICPDGEDPDSLSKQCDVNDFIEKNRGCHTLKAKFCRKQRIQSSNH